jgi:hypothetical protein
MVGSGMSSIQVLAARAAQHERWARTADRTEATAAMRAAGPNGLAYFENQVDPERKLPEAQRRAMAVSARKAYYARLALASARARKAAK